MLSADYRVVVSPDAVIAGAYLKKRREAAGLTLRAAARLYAYSALGAVAAEMLLGEAERGDVQLGTPALERLRTYFPFDVGIYECLADGLPVPRICVGCGCSWTDPCTDGDGRPCAWSATQEPRCTNCVDKAVTA